MAPAEALVVVVAAEALVAGAAAEKTEAGSLARAARAEAEMAAFLVAAVQEAAVRVLAAN